jgi:hypothetical protein
MEILLIAICIGTIPGFIAQSKGRSFFEWWLYGAALFIVALPHSLMIKADQEEIEREQLESGNSKKCPFCAEIIKKQAVVCRFCGRDLPTVTASAQTEFRRLAEKFNFVNNVSSTDVETWWAANDLGTSPGQNHNVYLMIQDERWRLGSNEREVADRIKRVPGNMTLEQSANLKVMEQGITGEKSDVLSAALRTYRWLVSR